MSRVTNVILTTMCGEGVEHENGPDTYPCTDAINVWLAELGHPPLLHVDPLWHGRKRIEADIWIGGFNYLDHDCLAAVVRAQPWDDPDSVQLFVNLQEESRFSEVLSGPSP